MSDTSAPPLFVPVLTRTDRCDTADCGAAAKVRVLVKPDLPLDFCGHHFAEFDPTAFEGMTVLDERTFRED